jgi:isopenicillin N synthase-like dioxygenase
MATVEAADKGAAQNMQRRIPELRFADYTGGEPGRREAFIHALMRGLQDYGFIVLQRHPVPAPLLEHAYQLIAAFFAQTEATKRRYIGGARGYVPFGIEHAKDCAEPDLKEFWQIGPERAAPIHSSPSNLWPDSPAEFRLTFLALFDALQDTGRLILEALTPGLGLPRSYFEPLLTERNSVLRLLHYPPIPTDVPDRSLRSAPHEDINLLTLLVAPEGPGLEILDRDGRWLPVPSQPHHLIVDAGDMLARMTNDVIPATTHRVVNPSGINRSRYSLPFFMHPNSDVVLTCMQSCIGAGAKYADITAGAFLEHRLREIGLLNRQTSQPSERTESA